MRRFALAALALATQAVAAPLPRYDHIFVLVDENHGFSQIIGNPAAPSLNALAQSYGLATNYTSVADPSLPNYIALVAGDVFGIADDLPFWAHHLTATSLLAQLDAAHLTWRGYFQGMPYAGYRGFCYPSRCNGIPDFDPLYSGKHNPLPYFLAIQTNPAERAKMEPLETLPTDLAANPPNFALIVPDQCHDMHGSPPWCGDGGNPGDVNDNQLVAAGDATAAAVVKQITAAAFWTSGNNALVLTFDEGNGTASCCGLPGTGKVATIVITSHGPRGLKDPTPYDHYALLLTIETALGLPCLAHACDSAIRPMTALFATGQ